MNNKKLVSLEKIEKRYGSSFNQVDALRDITLSLFRGDFVALIGPPGSGKSSLMNIIGMLEKPDSGKLHISGLETNLLGKAEARKVRCKTFGYLYPQLKLVEYFNVRENVKLGVEYRNNELENIEEAVLNALQLLDLSHKANEYPENLSLYECQRVSLAQAIVSGPDVLLADNPGEHLDSLHGQELMLCFKELNALGMTILFSTHNTKMAESACRAITLIDGRIVSDQINQGFVV
ncbi:ABC transporter ATP-binding protein [Planctobacterium marinum]|uniref:ABC transporter ATP-binding protein n=1 Tax=Planctobacterium marinum TaxID=1631968 RepID=UPI001E341264|nr:ABC transporter ATP-binding protein [Planctobacterium marinum]MCC2605741.1 ABC transporter ATP-binding protein [Planctobacterium marinum]